MSDVKLNFINKSNDKNNSEIVIFQKNVAESFGEIAVAWKVIKNCGRMDNHPFTFPLNINVAASDSYGNYTPQFNAVEGMAFEVVQDASGDVLKQCSTSSSDPRSIEIQNNLSKGAISGNVYKNGKLLAYKTDVVPGQKAVFQFEPRIYIGVASSVEEGQVMNSAIMSSINTELNLFGITSADIVMTGGGSGPSATAFKFTIENAVAELKKIE